MFDSKAEYLEYFNNAGDISAFINTRSLAQLICLELTDILELVIEKLQYHFDYDDYEEQVMLCQLALSIGSEEVIKTLILNWPNQILGYNDCRNWSQNLYSSILKIEEEKLFDLCFSTFEQGDSAPLAAVLTALNLDGRKESANNAIESLNLKLKLDSNFGQRHLLTDILLNSALDGKQIETILTARSKRHLGNLEIPNTGINKSSVLNFIDSLQELSSNTSLKELSDNLKNHSIHRDEELLDILIDSILITFD
ncbi:hypothetical protein [Vibrio maerlii]|uniref:hypothetical protein n=1 Tax=Vibrio maerlii TaxID=2231648 RepID=UPI000E3EA58E|nr:hypothetical protein [Vibrio maerlii]